MHRQLKEQQYRQNINSNTLNQAELNNKPMKQQNTMKDKKRNITHRGRKFEATDNTSAACR